MARFKRCVVHIGTEKTGTSSIQRFLSSNRAKLVSQGVVYPSACGDDGGSQMGFAACAAEKPWTSDLGSTRGIKSTVGKQKYCRDLQMRLEEEFEAQGDPETLIVSSEHFHSRLRKPGEIQQLKDYLAQWAESFKVVIYLRRQDRVAVSLYSTKLKTGNANPSVFPQSSESRLPYYFDYHTVCENWGAVFGPNSVDVRLFDRSEFVNGDLISDFCAAAGIRKKGMRVPKAENESLNRAGMDFIAEVNRQLPATADGHRNPLRDSLVSVVAKLCRGRSYPISKAEAESFYAQFAPGNDALRRRFFQDREQGLFDESFDDYPEKVEHTPGRYEDAVGLAIQLWARGEGGAVSAQAENQFINATTHKVVELTADNWYVWGMLALKNGKPQVAMQRFRASVAAQPEHFKANIELARLLLNAGKEEEGLGYLRAAKGTGKSNVVLKKLLERFGDRL